MDLWRIEGAQRRQGRESHGIELTKPRVIHVEAGYVETIIGVQIAGDGPGRGPDQSLGRTPIAKRHHVLDEQAARKGIQQRFAGGHGVNRL
ncbi:hypothetical protein MCOL_V212730 [Mycobacterium colombiense CECT 3035]|uniref:Uncharacterized protein n=2 Tax=Mycobacterium colombiense TaxID=339268 RepID=J5EHE5_9MYCO|nr:hypothetical protein MCOL_V212730 [Mycobacterium colombiense CECT 3035]